MIRVLYFAAAKERTERSEEDFDFLGPVENLLSELQARHPRLKEILPFCRIAVNQEFKSNDAAIRDGDEVALIPPVAGG